jgi:predicted nicotinamide N-methyase
MQGRDATATLSTPGGSDVTISVSQIDIANDEAQDPRLFEDDYDVASATGFRVWEASSLFVALLKQPSVQSQFAGRCVLELGSGTGFLAMAAASIGAHVLATDTRTVTVESIRPNIERNCSAASPMPPALNGFAVQGRKCVGAGSVAAAALDWHADARQQLAAAGVSLHFNFDVILAADCIWLLDVAAPFVNTLCSLMPAGCPSVAILCFQNRANDKSTAFVKLDQVPQLLLPPPSPFASPTQHAPVLHRASRHLLVTSPPCPSRCCKCSPTAAFTSK